MQFPAKVIRLKFDRAGGAIEQVGSAQYPYEISWP